MIQLVRSHNTTALANVMATGLSPNPCNSHGESLLHNICRRGFVDMLQVLLHHGASVQVADDYGRTPLHDACWAAEPAFATVKLLLERDPRLFHLMDTRGHVPLNYVREEHWPAWVQFLEDSKDVYWPPLPVGEKQGPPTLAVAAAGSATRTLPDPFPALSPELARMVASGRMKASEAQLLCRHDDPTESLTEEDDDSFFSSEDDDSYFGSSDYESEDDEIMEDLSGLLHSFQQACVSRQPTR